MIHRLNYHFSSYSSVLLLSSQLPGRNDELRRIWNGIIWTQIINRRTLLVMVSNRLKCHGQCKSLELPKGINGYSLSIPLSCQMQKRIDKILQCDPDPEEHIYPLLPSFSFAFRLQGGQGFQKIQQELPQQASLLDSPCILFPSRSHCR